MSAFPDDPILIARGKYSTLGREKRDQIERVAKIANIAQQHLLLALNGIQERPTVNRSHLDSLRACLGNFENAWTRIDELNAEMKDLKPLAWDEQDE